MTAVGTASALPAAPDIVLEDGDNVVVAYGEDGSFPTEPPTDALEAA